MIDNFMVCEVDPYDQASIDASMIRMKLPYTLPSLHRILLYAQEHIVVPEKCIGVIGIRSTWARLGLLPPTTFARPEWQGHLTLEVFNASRRGIKLAAGDVMWEFNVVFAPWEEPYTGRYQNQGPGVQMPKALK